MPDGELSGQHTDRTDRRLHHFDARRREESVDGRAIRVHLILAQALQLEEHGVEIAATHDLLLDRFLDSIDRDHLVTN